MIILDTNIVSEVLRGEPDRRVIAWLDARVSSDLAITVVTVSELLIGAYRLPAGRRRDVLTNALAEMLEIEFAGRILPFDEAAAVEHARLTVTLSAQGIVRSMNDLMIAAIAVSHSAHGIATRNTRDFTDCGVDLIDPWQA